MKLKTYLEKFFDVDDETTTDEATCCDITTLTIFERGEDAEPLLYLYSTPDNLWRVGNVYSSLAHGAIFEECTLKAMARDGKFVEPSPQRVALKAFPDGEFTRREAKDLITAFPALKIEDDQITHFRLALRENDGCLIWRCWNFEPGAGEGLKKFL